MTSQDLRQKYIDFFKSRGHAEIPSASLIPENDPSILFTTAGMSPLVPFLLGEKHPAGSKLVNSQKCIRTGDIDEIGDACHHTFFEMLGHWSLNDYFKTEAIELTYEFIIQELKIEQKYLAVSVFEGDNDAPFDAESFQKWQELGFSEKRIAKLSKKDNWWELPGNSGPCGPDTEMFYWTGDKNSVPEVFDPENKNWVEIGNDVIMQYEKIGENKYKSATQKNIDNGTGLERLLAVMNDLDDNYQTDLFLPIINKIEELSGKKYTPLSAVADTSPYQGEDEDIPSFRRRGLTTESEGEVKSIRIIADHLRAATFIMADSAGIAPSNTDQGYVMRKLIRRAIRHGKSIGISQNFCAELAEVVIDNMKDVYPELEKNKKFVLDNLSLEEDKFRKTLEQGLEKFNKLESINGQEAFNLYQTYGFPFEMTKELAHEKGLEIDENDFNLEMQRHQDLSRTASVGKFKGGLANHSEKVVKYHTAAHLILAGLRQVLGEHVFQKGSNITDERLRLDFSHAEKMTLMQIKAVEDFVNTQIKQDLPVVCTEMALDEAKIKGAMGVFENKYGERVKVYDIGSETDPDSTVSSEICGGPHVEHTGVLGHFKIIKEEASSAGVRRIKAILE
ncbi:MAG TPA: alanine--tRNA ligase [bacterium]|nr:alanine--tRNA ligase [bacterium]